MAPIKFYHHPMSPPSRIVLLTIRNLNLDANIEVVDLMNKAQLNPEFLKKNPQHTVPTIEDDGFVLWESRAIASYLVSAKAPGSSLYPSDVKKKAIVDARMYLEQTLQVCHSTIAYPIFLGEATTIPNDMKQKVYQILGNLNSFLEGQKYAAGDELTIADLGLLATITSLYELGANVSKFKNIADWYKRMESVPGHQENYEGAKALGNFLRSKANISGKWDD